MSLDSGSEFFSLPSNSLTSSDFTSHLRAFVT